MRAKPEHPDLLLWYVSGAIGLRERREIDLHLLTCEECRAEVASLSSLMKSVRVQDRWDHVGAADLVLYEEEPVSMPGDRRAAVESHLAECPRCRADLATLGEARRRETDPIPAGEARTKRRAMPGGWILATSAAGLLLILATWPYRFGPDRLGSSRPEPSSVVFPAPLRAAEAMRTLEGSGPWRIRVLLPFDAQEGRYRIDYRRVGGSPLPGVGVSASTDADLCLSVVLDSLPGPGRYEMSLRPDPAKSDESYHYSFRLLAPAASGQGPGSR